MTKIKDVLTHLEDFAPLAYQEEYDNSGLLTGDSNQDLTGILICIDSTEDVIEEAIMCQCNLVIAHHPIIFRGIRKLTGAGYVERVIIKAIRNGIAIYAIHTNLDNIRQGVNRKICDMLSLQNVTVLQPKQDKLMKLVTFTPVDHRDQVLEALHQAGAGNIGKYEKCSFRVEGMGRFMPGKEANPFIGEKEHLEEVCEERIEVIFPSHKKDRILDMLNSAHPYEEVAYYLQELANDSGEVGSGMAGFLEHEMKPVDFLRFLKDRMKLNMVRYTAPDNLLIRKIGVCGGAGAFLLKKALQSGAQAFITADIKYHDFFETEGKLMLVDVGHYESEQFTKELIYDLLSKKFSNIALRLSEVNTNPIRYI